MEPAWIALIVAIVSPLVTALINNHHESKMKKIDIIFNKKLLAFSKMTDAYGDLDRYHNGLESLWKFISCAYSAALFASPDDSDKIYQIINLVKDAENRTPETDMLFQECIKSLAINRHKI